MNRLFIGSVLAAVACFLWGFLFWGTPLSTPAFGDGEIRGDLAQVLAEHLPADGTYYVPGMRGDLEALAALHERGPLATIHFRRAGAPIMNPSVMIFGFLHMFATAFLLGLMMRGALSHLGTFQRRLMFAVGVGVIGAFWGQLSGVIWWYYPASYPIMTFLYDIVSFVVMGAVLAWQLKTETKTAVP
jgi:hypothetical protein